MEEQTRLRGWLVAKNLNINCLGKYQDLGFVYQYDDRLHKFPQDEVFLSDGERISFLDGYIYNKEAFICPEGYHDWQRSFALSLGKDVAAHLEKMRGAFCGYSYERETGDVIIYTDQVSNKALYYYVEGDKWMISNYVALIVRVLRANRITCHFNPTAARYMLTYGYMLDDSTFVTQIRRLLPGHYGKISDGRVRLFKYYEIPCDEEQMSEKEAVEQIDSAFRQAIVREFTKDREYGYRHLVDLSGGLDSRMVTWTAHELGFREQVNIAYSRLDYLDQKISAQVAMALKHEYLYKAMDDLTWMYDVDEMTCKNNGAAVCLGMTGGNRLLRMLDKETFGIEHTGMVGDAIVSTFYHDKNLNDQSPVFGLNQYSNFLRYSFDEKILTQYKKQEIFAVVTRGLLGAQSSYMIRQNYLETGSPFLDVDFLAAVMAVPFAYRKNHHIYLKWIADRYPAAADFIWEKWGVKPRESEIFKRKIKTTGKLAAGYLQKVSHKPSRSSMNPMDYWYQNDMDVRKYVETMYKERIADDSLPEDLRHDMKLLFTAGNFTEKTQVLTVLSAMYLFC
jgi:asparagine synthase (glutamine-hydrolysing)